MSVTTKTTIKKTLEEIATRLNEIGTPNDGGAAIYNTSNGNSRLIYNSQHFSLSILNDNIIKFETGSKLPIDEFFCAELKDLQEAINWMTK